MFVTAVNRLVSLRKTIENNYRMNRDIIFDTECFDEEQRTLQDELTVTAELIQKIIDENAHTQIDQEEYKKRYESLAKRFEAAKSRLEEIANIKADRIARRTRCDGFMKELKKQGTVISEFDDRLWHTLMDHIIVYSKDDVRFVFKNGTEIKI